MSSTPGKPALTTKPSPPASVVTPSNEELATLTVDDIDVDFLPLIYDLIRSLDKERDNQDTTHKVQELKTKLSTARDQINKLPGITYNKQDQVKLQEALLKQLDMKKDLLLKYKNTFTF